MKNNLKKTISANHELKSSMSEQEYIEMKFRAIVEKEWNILSPEYIEWGLEITLRVCRRIYADFDVCEGCGDCCNQDELTLEREDIGAISKHLGLSRSKFVHDYLEKHGEFFCLKECGPCVFLDDAKRCKIYPVRPFVCKCFPSYSLSLLSYIPIMASQYLDKQEMMSIQSIEVCMQKLNKFVQNLIREEVDSMSKEGIYRPQMKY